MTRDGFEEFEDLVEEIGVHFADRGVHAVLRGGPELVRPVQRESGLLTIYWSESTESSR